MPKYVVDPDSQYKKGTVDKKRVTTTEPQDLTKDQITRLEEAGVTLVEYKDADKTNAGASGNNN